MKIAYLLIVLLLIPMVSAEVQTLPPQRIYDSVTITQSHGNMTSANLTKIRYPNSTEVYDVKEMLTENNINYFYLFNDTNQIGEYIVTTCGNGDGVRTCVDYNFPITPSGFLGTSAFYFLLLLLSFGILALGFWKEDAAITIFGSFGLYLFALYVLFFGIDGLKDPVYTWGIGLITLGIAMYVSTRASYELIVN